MGSEEQKHENATRRLGTAENEFGSTKRENGTRHSWYSRKPVWE
jgi:hypothetical protein